MTMLAGYFQETPRAAIMPWIDRGKIRALFGRTLPAWQAAPEYYETHQPLPPRHEAMIAAARTALGGMIDW